MKIPDSLKKSISSKVLKKAETEGSKVSGSKELDNVSKNLSFLPNIAKDLNIARQNIFKLVKLEGGKPIRASNVSSDKANKSPTPISKEQTPKKEKEESSFEKGQRFANFFLDLISPKKILSKISIGTIWMAAGIITLFKDVFVGLAEDIWDAIKESFSGFIDYVKQWFNDIGKPILDELTKFMDKIWTKIKDFFKPIFEWVGEKINSILDFLQPVFKFVGDVFGKVMVVVNEFKDKLTFLTDTYNSIQIQIEKAKKTLKEASAPTEEAQYDQFGNVISDSGAAAAADAAEKAKKQKEAATTTPTNFGNVVNPYEGQTKTAPQTPAQNAVPSSFGNVVNPYEGQTKTQGGSGRGGRGGPSAADIAKKDLTPSQLKWLGDADPTDPYIMSRMPPPQPGEKGGPPLTAPSAAPALPSGVMAPPPTTPSAVPSKPAAPAGPITDSKAMIIRHEGKAEKVPGGYRPYKDSKGLWTIGIGHLIGDGKTLPKEFDRVFTEEEVMKMFDDDYASHAAAAAKIPGFNLLSKSGQDALIDMTFNMGNNWFSKWPSFVKKLSSGDFQGAADELLYKNANDKSKGYSDWYTQVKGRAVEIISLIRNSTSASPVQTAQAPVSPPTPPAIPVTSKPITSADESTGPSKLKLEDFIKFGTESGQKLNWELLDEKFKQKILSVLQAYKSVGGKLPVQLASATRTQQDQERIYNTWLAAGGGPDKKTAGGITTPAKPVSMGGNYNAHTGGAAVDFGGAAKAIALAVGGTQGDLSKFGLKWGGSFTKPDDVHIQDAAFPLGGVTAKQAAASGFDVSRTSVSIAADQRAQQKPETPMVVDASTTNNTQVANNNSSGYPKDKTYNTNKKMVDRVT